MIRLVVWLETWLQSRSRWVHVLLIGICLAALGLFGVTALLTSQRNFSTPLADAGMWICLIVGILAIVVALLMAVGRMK